MLRILMIMMTFFFSFVDPEAPRNQKQTIVFTVLLFFDSIHCKKKYAAVWNQKLYIGEYSGISSSKLKNS
jgi:hypothetical protein